jgi:hypothetical protein
MLVQIMVRRTRYTLSFGIKISYVHQTFSHASHPELVHKMEYEHVRGALEVVPEILESFVSSRPLFPLSNS